MKTLHCIALLSFAAVAIPACAGGEKTDTPSIVCELEEDDVADYLTRLGCVDDFDVLGSESLNTAIPGARSTKVLVDRADEERLYFQNSRKYPIHWDFARAHLSGNGKPVVGELSLFNDVEYYRPDRRFILGSLNHYEGPDAWVFEISPYDTADAEMITVAYRKIAKQAPFIEQLFFHPTSEGVERVLEELPEDVDVISSEEIFSGIDYQPLNLAEAFGRLRFVEAARLEDEFVNFRDIVVLDAVPNDISVVSGIVTAEFQTPLSHINVLSQNRGTPNMGLRDATEHEELRALEGQWVKLDVNALGWSIREATEEEADEWWDGQRPPAIQVPKKDLDVSGLVDIDDLLDEELSQEERISAAIPAFGGKASHFAELASIEGVPVPRGFAIPVSYYESFMVAHGFNDRVEELLDDSDFKNDARVRAEELERLREDIMSAPLDEVFLEAVEKKTTSEFPGIRMRFRSSTNAEDLDGFTGAGLYTSKSGDAQDPSRPIADAIREVWASVWFFRAFEERSYRGISHLDVGMALLVHRSFPDEYANGVAVTSNIFDSTGLEPGFYINVQRGEASVVQPEPGVSTDQILLQFDRPGHPATYLGHSTEVLPGETVLTQEQLVEVGAALQAIHQHFAVSYGPKSDKFGGWYAMDVEFKFNSDEPGEEPLLVVKQARPHPGCGE